MGGSARHRLDRVRAAAVDGFDADLWRQVRDLDLQAIGLPESDGGVGGDLVDLALVVEERGRTIAPVPLVEQVVVLRLLAAQQEAGKVTVRIGHETAVEQMVGTSMVSTVYGTSDTVYGGMGVLGPTRMDYPGTMASVAAVALYISEVLGAR